VHFVSKCVPEQPYNELILGIGGFHTNGYEGIPDVKGGILSIVDAFATRYKLKVAAG
jgi:hypothetical protein